VVVSSFLGAAVAEGGNINDCERNNYEGPRTSFSETARPCEGAEQRRAKGIPTQVSIQRNRPANDVVTNALVITTKMATTTNMTFALDLNHFVNRGVGDVRISSSSVRPPSTRRMSSSYIA